MAQYRKKSKRKIRKSFNKRNNRTFKKKSRTHRSKNSRRRKGGGMASYFGRCAQYTDDIKAFLKCEFNKVLEAKRANNTQRANEKLEKIMTRLNEKESKFRIVKMPHRVNPDVAIFVIALYNVDHTNVETINIAEELNKLNFPMEAVFKSSAQSKTFHTKYLNYQLEALQK